MIADAWNELMKLGDEVKEEYGADSEAYKVLREYDRRLQKIYDRHNRLTDEVLKKPCGSYADAEILGIKGCKVLKDDEGYRYSVGHYHFETAAEVLDFIIKDRNNRYDELVNQFVDALMDSVESAAIGLFNRANADFHEALDLSKPQIRRQFKVKLQREMESE